MPAVVIGLIGKKTGLIDRFLESVEVVAVMLVVGGVFMLFCDSIFNKGSEDTKITEKRAFRIGLFQCIAMIPGVSRSMATIVGGMAQKLTTPTGPRPTIWPCSPWAVWWLLSWLCWP